MAPSAHEILSLNSVADSSEDVVKNLKDFIHNFYTEASTHTSAQANQSAGQASSSKLPAAWNPPTSLDALALTRDAATLIRAHSTKLSLLIINEPFTPSAISRVIQEVVRGPVAALAKAVEVCYGDRYTYCVQRDVALRSEAVLGQVLQLLESIPRDGKVLSTAVDKKAGSSGSKSRLVSKPLDRSNFTNIGILWQECDDLIALAELGVKRRVIQIMEQLSATIKDTLEELKEWSEEEDDEDDSGDDDDDNDDTAGEADLEDSDSDQKKTGSDSYDDAQAALDAFMDSSSRHIPAGDPDVLRPRLDMSLKKIRLVGLLFSAIIKRRLRTLPSDLPTLTPTDTAPRLDAAVAALKALPDTFDDLAMAFYDLNRTKVDKLMESGFAEACAAAELLVKPWEAKEGDTEEKKDEFGAWVCKFQTEMRTKLLAEA